MDRAVGLVATVGLATAINFFVAAVAVGCGSAFTSSLGDLDASPDNGANDAGGSDSTSADVVSPNADAGADVIDDHVQVHDGPPNLCCKTATASVTCEQGFACLPALAGSIGCADPSTSNCSLGAQCTFNLCTKEGPDGSCLEACGTEEPDGWPASCFPDGAVVADPMGTVVDCQ